MDESRCRPEETPVTEEHTAYPVRVDATLDAPVSR
jgi:hypothetical protein